MILVTGGGSTPVTANGPGITAVINLLRERYNFDISAETPLTVLAAAPRVRSMRLYLDDASVLPVVITTNPTSILFWAPALDEIRGACGIRLAICYSIPPRPLQQGEVYTVAIPQEPETIALQSKWVSALCCAFIRERHALTTAMDSFANLVDPLMEHTDFVTSLTPAARIHLFYAGAVSARHRKAHDLCAQRGRFLIAAGTLAGYVFTLKSSYATPPISAAVPDLFPSIPTPPLSLRRVEPLETVAHFRRGCDYLAKTITAYLRETQQPLPPQIPVLDWSGRVTFISSPRLLAWVVPGLLAGSVTPTTDGEYRALVAIGIRRVFCADTPVPSANVPITPLKIFPIPAIPGPTPLAHTAALPTTAQLQKITTAAKDIVTAAIDFQEPTLVCCADGNSQTSALLVAAILYYWQREDIAPISVYSAIDHLALSRPATKLQRTQEETLMFWVSEPAGLRAEGFAPTS